MKDRTYRRTIELRLNIGTGTLIKRSNYLGRMRVEISVTRFGDLFDFGKVFKAFGNN